MLKKLKQKEELDVEKLNDTISLLDKNLKSDKMVNYNLTIFKIKIDF